MHIKQILKQIFKIDWEEPYFTFELLGHKFRYASKYRKLSHQITQEALWMHEKMDREFARLDAVNYAKIMDIFEEALSTYALHQKVFAPYKNRFQGRSVVLCGAGPTLNKYKPIEGAVHVALNRAFTYEKVRFDFIFMQDKRTVLIEDIVDKLIAYEPATCVKFIGTQNGNPVTEISESVALHPNFFRFNTDGFNWDLGGGGKFIKDIAARALGNFNSIAFPAMQFILYTNPAKIYLAGCDATPTGHFDHKETPETLVLGQSQEIYNFVNQQWKILKEFAQFNYPETKIYSINPVGLKGLFEDIYD